MSEVQTTPTPTTPAVSTAPKPVQRTERTGQTNSSSDRSSNGQRRSFNNRSRDGSSSNSTGTTGGNRSDRPSRPGGDRRNSGDRPTSRNDRGATRPGGRNDRRQQKEKEEPLYESKVIEVRRVTRVVKGGKRMRFSALVVVGDRNGKVGFGLKKGLDFADAVAKATKKATGSVIKVSLDKNKSISFTSNTKHKSAEIFLKPATHGTGLIAGGFVRPVLELAGVENVYSKINRTRNKIPGVQCVIKALQKYSANKQ
jgi:small subunit ribosomal protein S5